MLFPTLLTAATRKSSPRCIVMPRKVARNVWGAAHIKHILVELVSWLLLLVWEGNGKSWKTFQSTMVTLLRKSSIGRRARQCLFNCKKFTPVCCIVLVVRWHFYCLFILFLHQTTLPWVVWTRSNVLWSKTPTRWIDRSLWRDKKILDSAIGNYWSRLKTCKFLLSINYILSTLVSMHFINKILASLK